MADHVFAAIDIGSNALRINVAKTADGILVKQLLAERFPLRLGSDTFKQGVIGGDKIEKLVEIFQEFRKIFDRFKVSDYLAVATSAMREAENGSEIVQHIYKKTGIELQLISGLDEAQLVQLGVNSIIPFKNTNMVTMDIGGGSVEFIHSSNGEVNETLSLKIGTVRLLEFIPQDKPYIGRERLEAIVQNEFNVLRAIQQKLSSDNKHRRLLVVTGGNARSLNKMARTIFRHDQKEKLSLLDVEMLTAILFGMSYEDRLRKLDLKQDRADVILSASLLILKAMQFFHFHAAITPNISLRDGLIAKMCFDLTQ